MPKKLAVGGIIIYVGEELVCVHMNGQPTGDDKTHSGRHKVGPYKGGVRRGGACLRPYEQAPQKGGL